MAEGRVVKQGFTLFPCERGWNNHLFSKGRGFPSVLQWFSGRTLAVYLGFIYGERLSL